MIELTLGGVQGANTGESQVAVAGLTLPLARITHTIELTQGGVQGGHWRNHR